MKKLILFLFALAWFSANSQNCGVTSEWFHSQLAAHKKLAKNNATNIDPSPNNVQYIPLAVYFVLKSDGTYSKHNDVNVFFHSIFQTNRLLSDHGIQFYISSLNYINDSNLLLIDITQATALFANHRDQNATNVYIIDDFTDQASGYGSPDALYFSDITEGTVPHEIGHYLTLAHTFDVPADGGAELADGSNCATAGDKICDTPADPGTGAVTHDNCVMTNNAEDSQGTLYNPPFENIMSYYGGMCGYEFTPMQFARMIQGYNDHHTGYTASAEITGNPTLINIQNKNGYDQLNWTNAANSKGTQIEFSSDSGSSWRVMNGVLPGVTSYVISNTKAGVNYKIRLRHLNSKTYSTIDYNPTISSVDVPVITQNGTFAITEVKLAGTSINHSSTGNEYYTFVVPNTDAQLFIGSSYTLNLKPDNYVGHFSVYLDENGDGDFDDAGETKFTAPNNDPAWNVAVNLTISQNSTAGYKRLRIRTNQGSNTHSPNGFYNWSETEDFVVKLIQENAPASLSAAFNSNNNSVDISWNDTFDSYKYIIERSSDGVNFAVIATTTDGLTKSYSDATAPPNSQLEYRIKREGGSLYSETSIAYTGNYASSYCVPTGQVNPCTSNYGISKVSIASLSFTNDSSAGCGVTSAGYSDYYGTHTINFAASGSYTMVLENSAFNFHKDLRIYIDYNQNGVFEANEIAFDNNVQTPPQATAVINVPADAINGNTRMRIRAYYNAITDACSDVNYGETEDYKVNISGGKESAVINAMAQNPSSSSIELSWDVANGASPTGFVIKQSTNGVDFAEINTLGASERNYTVVSLSENQKYYFQIIAIGSSNSDPKTVWNSTSGALATDISNIDAKINIFPNPTKDGSIIVKSNGNIENVELFDLNGRLLKQLIMVKQGNSLIKIDGIDKGSHIVRFRIDGEYFSKIISSQ